MAGPARHGEVDAGGDVFPAVPAREIAELVGTEDEGEGGVGMRSLQGTQGVDGVAGPVALEFDVAAAQPSVTVNGPFEHGPAMGLAGGQSVTLPGLAGGDEPDGVERELALGTQGQFQMGGVNGIEAAAQQTNAPRLGLGLRGKGALAHAAAQSRGLRKTS